jgi:hypothetical protein
MERYFSRRLKNDVNDKGLFCSSKRPFNMVYGRTPMGRLYHSGIGCPGLLFCLPNRTHRPVQFEITEQKRTSVAAWIDKAHLSARDYLFPSRVIDGGHITTRQYARIVASWAGSIGLNPAAYGTHTMRRTKVTLIYRQTKTCVPCNCCWGIPS